MLADWIQDLNPKHLNFQKINDVKLQQESLANPEYENLELENRVDMAFKQGEYASLFEIIPRFWRPIAEITNHLNLEVPLLSFMSKKYPQWNLDPKR